MFFVNSLFQRREGIISFFYLFIYWDIYKVLFVVVVSIQTEEFLAVLFFTQNFHEFAEIQIHGTLSFSGAIQNLQGSSLFRGKTTYLKYLNSSLVF